MKYPLQFLLFLIPLLPLQLRSQDEICLEIQNGQTICGTIHQQNDGFLRVLMDAGKVERLLPVQQIRLLHFSDRTQLEKLMTDLERSRDADITAEIHRIRLKWIPLFHLMRPTDLETFVALAQILARNGEWLHAVVLSKHLVQSIDPALLLFAEVAAILLEGLLKMEHWAEIERYIAEFSSNTVITKSPIYHMVAASAALHNDNPQFALDWLVPVIALHPGVTFPHISTCYQLAIRIAEDLGDHSWAATLQSEWNHRTEHGNSPNNLTF